MEDRSRRQTLESLGGGIGIFDPRQFQWFSSEEATAAYIYGDDADIRNVLVRNLEPGQENPAHTHVANAHVIYVLEGSGLCLRGDAPDEPMHAGQILVIPARVVHGARNTGTTRLSYVTIVPWGIGGLEATR